MWCREACNHCAKPLLHSFFHFVLMSLALEAVDGLAELIQRNEVTGYVLINERGGDEIDEGALAARAGALRKVEIEAGG